MRNWNQEALSDSRDMVANFDDEICVMAREGEVSTDFNNDYPNGDAYHHETHIDKEYRLADAAELLDALSDDEETDYGLWEGLEPRRAISAQAAYTYGNAVASRWASYVNELNDALDGIDGEDRREAVARIWIHLLTRYDSVEGQKAALVNAAYVDIGQGSFDGAAILADWIEEHDNDGRESAPIRRALAMVKEEIES